MQETQTAQTEEFAAFLRALKSRSNRSYEELSQRAGVGRSTLHRYCVGNKVPTEFAAVHTFAMVCGATPRELRELHRLWALADASVRNRPAPGPDHTGTGGPEPDADPLADPADPADLTTVDTPPAPAETVATGPAENTPTDPTTTPPATPSVPETVSAPAAGPTPTAAPVPDAVPLPTAVPVPDTVPAPKGGRGHRGWLVAGVAVLLVAAAVLGLILTRSKGAPESAVVATGSPTSDRLLFSAACREPVGLGQHDPCTLEVQQLLKKAGATLEIDSDFGPETLRRVTAFQVLAGLPARGVVDDATKRALYAGKVSMVTWSAAQAERRIREVFGAQADRAVAIAYCQSYLDPLYVTPNPNGTRNWGVFQLTEVRVRELGGTPRLALDPEWNIQAAYRLSEGGRDFSHWACDRALSRPSPTPRK